MQPLCDEISYLPVPMMSAMKSNADCSSAVHTPYSPIYPPHVITANEGAALAASAGHYLGTSQFSAVYLQNSGFGNLLNPLLSLAHKDVYRIPALLLIGWRGEPTNENETVEVPPLLSERVSVTLTNRKFEKQHRQEAAKRSQRCWEQDEPQHCASGSITRQLMEVAGLTYAVVRRHEGEAAFVSMLEAAVRHLEVEKTPYALLFSRCTVAAQPSVPNVKKLKDPMRAPAQPRDQKFSFGGANTPLAARQEMPPQTVTCAQNSSQNVQRISRLPGAWGNSKEPALTRELAIRVVLEALQPMADQCAVVGSTGMISREIEYIVRQEAASAAASTPKTVETTECSTTADPTKRDVYPPDFLMVGSMGHAISIGMGLALVRRHEKQHKYIYVLDGDGAAIMHLGSMAVAAAQGEHTQNLVHIILNNGAHDSVGGQPTCALKWRGRSFRNSEAADSPGLPTETSALRSMEEESTEGEAGWLSWVAASMGYDVLSTPVATAKDLRLALVVARKRHIDGNAPAPAFLEVLVEKGHRKGLGRPTRAPAEALAAFMSRILGH